MQRRVATLFGLLVAPVPPPPTPLDPPPSARPIPHFSRVQPQTPSAPLRSSGSPDQGWLMGSSLGALSTRRKSTSFRVGGESAAEADDERGPSMVRV